jgi:hypothetical protein
MIRDFVLIAMVPGFVLALLYAFTMAGREDKKACDGCADGRCPLHGPTVGL